LPTEIHPATSAKTQDPRIIITGDGLRCEAPAGLYGQLTNARWLFGLLEQPVAEATGIQPELVFASFSDDTDIAEIYSKLGLPLNATGWIKIFNHVPDHVTELLYGNIEGALVIGFELPPGLISSMGRLGAKVLNIGIHPVRFMDDIFLGFQTPEPTLADGLARHAMHERLAYRAAGLIKAFAARDPLTRFPAPAAVFAGQIAIDRSLIRDGRLITADDLVETIEKTFGRYETVLLKPHPLALDNPVIDRIMALGLSTQTTDLDFYRLVSHPDVAAVIAISSGTCQEATYFGKEGIHLSHCATPCLWRDSPPDEDGWWSIYDHFLVPDFWRAILAPIINVTPMDGDKPLPKPNRLRISLRGFWGFSHIDPRTLVLHSGVASNLDLVRKELAFLRRLRRFAGRLERIPVIGWVIRGLIRLLR
jgi:hypothetical protein